MSGLNKLVLLLVLLIAVQDAPSSISTRTKSAGLEEDFVIAGSKTAVALSNKLDGLNLTIHCKSKDDDLGTHVIAPGEIYQWRFHINVLGTTLFFCHLSWRDKSGTFDIYDAYRDIFRCPLYCEWLVNATGSYSYDTAHKQLLVFPWP